MKKLLTLLALITTCLSASADETKPLFDGVYTIKHGAQNYYAGIHRAEAFIYNYKDTEGAPQIHNAILNYFSDAEAPTKVGTKFDIRKVGNDSNGDYYTIKFAESENAYLYAGELDQLFDLKNQSVTWKMVSINNTSFEGSGDYSKYYWRFEEVTENGSKQYIIRSYSNNQLTWENCSDVTDTGYIRVANRTLEGNNGGAVSWTISSYEGTITPITNAQVDKLQKKIDDLVYGAIQHPTVGYPYWDPDPYSDENVNSEFRLLEGEISDSPDRVFNLKWLNFSVYDETLSSYHKVCAAKYVTLPKNDRTYKIKARFNTSEPDIYTYKYLAYNNEKSDCGQLKTVETEELATPWIVKVISEEKTGISAALIDANSGKFLYVESAAKYNSSDNKATYSNGNIPTVKISKQSPDHHGGIPSFIDDCTLGCLVIEGAPFGESGEFALTVNSNGTICDVPTSQENFKYYYEGTTDGEGQYLLSSQFVFEEVENPNKVIISNPRPGENATELDNKWIGTFSAPYDVDLSDIQVETVVEKTEEEMDRMIFRDYYNKNHDESSRTEEEFENLFEYCWWDEEFSDDYYWERLAYYTENEGWEEVISYEYLQEYEYWNPTYSYRKTTRTPLLYSEEEAYTAELSGSKIFLHKLESNQNVLPRNTGIIFILTQAKANNYNETHKTNKVTEYAYPYVGAAPTQLATNHLLGSGGFATAMTNSEYVLAAKSPDEKSIGVGFYKSKVGNLARNKAYFSLQNGESISAFQYIFDEGEQTTSILSAHQDADNISNTYDLSGRKIEGGQFRGVCIRNGHKVIR